MVILFKIEQVITMFNGKRIYYWFVGHKSRVNYWSCGDFAERLRKIFGVTEKPFAETTEGWCRWKSENVGKFGYWVTETLLDSIQDVYLFIPDVYYNVRYFIYNRFIDKTHYINTKLKKGNYHGFDTRLLHGLFEMLVDFVEVEKASRQFTSEYISEGKEAYDKKDHSTPSREAGLKYLDWEIGLSEEDGGIGQADAAAEIKELYLWWKDVRPNRTDPMDESGWSEHCEAERLAGRGLFGCSTEEKSDEDEERINNILKLMNKLSMEQEQEDTDMLIRLVKIRKACWT